MFAGHQGEHLQNAVGYAQGISTACLSLWSTIKETDYRNANLTRRGAFIGMGVVAARCRDSGRVWAAGPSWAKRRAAHYNRRSA